MRAPCHHASPASLPPSLPPSLPLCRCLRSRVPHLSMNQGRHPLGLRYIAAWVGRWRIACLPACLVGWMVDCKIRVGNPWRKISSILPLFLLPPSYTTRAHAKICVQHVVETTCLYCSRKSRENLRIFQWEECATTLGFCRLGCNLGYRALASLR